MNNKLSYNRPEIEIIEVSIEGVIAQSPTDPQIDNETTHGGGTSRSKKFWGNIE